MLVYQAPLRDIRFVLLALLGSEDLTRLPAFSSLTPDTLESVLDAAARFCERELLPLARSGDEEGCRFEDGTVRTPRGFAEAYRLFRDQGWASLACDPAVGGQGLPELLNLAVSEMVCSTNLAFGTYTGLAHAAYLLLAAHGTGDVRERYLKPLAEGRWGGTMCLTEPQCGTDLGLTRARAEPAEDGSYRVTGTKIFVTAGEHDLTDNILHLVLARLPGSPEGTRGLSLFLVPKLLVGPDGRLGDRNRVWCGGIEEKMGLHASATCTLSFEAATGYLLGEREQGLRAMFTMMNTARLGVGVQGLGLAETAYQNALAYARERRQGRVVGGAGGPEAGPAPIILHPDVRRMLLRMRAFTEGARALVYWIGREIDLARHHPDPERRQAADDLVQLLTPVVKAFLTDEGFAAANLGLQVFGGHGYIREHGMERLVREARIGQIYEGTNGVQALDLVGRKLRAGHGRMLRRFFHPLSAFLDERADDAAMAEFAVPLGKAFRLLQDVTVWLATAADRDPVEGAAAASGYLRLLGLLALGYLWARMADIALRAPGRAEDEAFYAGKLATARFFMSRVLPETVGLGEAIRSGSAPLVASDAL